MNKKPILNIALPTPLPQTFDYLAGSLVKWQTLAKGVRIRVPFHKKEMIGVYVGAKETSEVPPDKLKPVIDVLDEEPIFTPDVYDLCEWAAHYYHYPLGEVFAAAMPTLLRKGAKTETIAISASTFNEKNADVTPGSKNSNALQLNAGQAEALAAINAADNSFKTFLLDGITSSGKTEVYLQAIAHQLAQGKQALVLIPEISLTPQTIARFRSRFDVPVVALHSSLSEKKRAAAYLGAKSGIVKIIIGTRSAIFTPFEQLGLIIIDEEHDLSFKQQERFRYHARDLAIVRASMNKIPIVLGSATPSLESIYNVKVTQRYTYLHLPQRAGNAQLPRYELINLRQEKKHHGLSVSLLEKIKNHLAANNQVLIFLNKRGFAPVYYCLACSHILPCQHCSTHLVYHHKPKKLHCHHCDFRMQIPDHCPVCKDTQLEPVGVGTQRLEETLSEHFPDTPIIRVDRDNTRRKGAMQKLVNDIHSAKNAILIGTQMLAKGHHFPNITMVGVIDADSGFFSVDFRASEQLGQLLLQVGGRAGREDKPGEVLLQTINPNNEALQRLLQEGYGAFANFLLEQRRKTALPPFHFLARFRAEAKDEIKSKNFLQWLKSRLVSCTAQSPPDIDVLGPVPAMIAKRKGLYGYHLLLKATKRSHLQHYLTAIMPQLYTAIPKEFNRIRWTLDVDPVEV